MRILVIDDDRRLCAVIKRGLLEEAYAVDLAYDGEEGAYLAEGNPYDLIILDITLPSKDGLPVCQELRVGALILNPLTRQVWLGQRPIELTTKEYVILEYFMCRPNVVVTRTMIEEHAWDYDFDSLSNLVDVYIRRLRRKIDSEGEDSLIQTDRKS